MASSQLQAIVKVLRSRPPLTELSIEDQRATFDALTSRFEPADDVHCQPVDAGGVPAEWITTPEAADGRVGGSGLASRVSGIR